MPSTRDIRRRIKSVKNTAQITKAMQMVAASKMRKAQQVALAGRPYATLMNEVLGEAYELVERELLDVDEFRRFTFANPALLHAAMNPDFFRGTAIEVAVDSLLAENRITS